MFFINYNDITHLITLKIRVVVESNHITVSNTVVCGPLSLFTVKCTKNSQITISFISDHAFESVTDNF